MTKFKKLEELKFNEMKLIRGGFCGEVHMHSTVYPDDYYTGTWAKTDPPSCSQQICYSSCDACDVADWGGMTKGQVAALSHSMVRSSNYHA